MIKGIEIYHSYTPREGRIGNFSTEGIPLLIGIEIHFYFW